MKVKLAELLLRRKELEQKVKLLAQIDQDKLRRTEVRRQQVTDTLEDIQAKVPRITAQQVTHCYDTHAKWLRLVDAAIQQANWTTELEVADDVMSTYEDPYVEDN